MGQGLTQLELALIMLLAGLFSTAVAGIIRWGVRRHIKRIDDMEAVIPGLVTEKDMDSRILEVLQQISAMRAEGASGDKTILQSLGDFRGEQNREIGALRQEIGAAHRRMDNLFRAPPSFPG